MDLAAEVHTCDPSIPCNLSTGRCTQENQKLGVYLRYIVGHHPGLLRPCLKNKTKNKKQHLHHTAGLCSEPHSNNEGGNITPRRRLAVPSAHSRPVAKAVPEHTASDWPLHSSAPCLSMPMLILTRSSFLSSIDILDHTGQLAQFGADVKTCALGRNPGGKSCTSHQNTSLFTWERKGGNEQGGIILLNYLHGVQGCKENNYENNKQLNSSSPTLQGHQGARRAAQACAEMLPQVTAWPGLKATMGRQSQEGLDPLWPPAAASFPGDAVQLQPYRALLWT